ncbi:MAG: cadherin repeat domain-containing protein [Cyclobacteriaceae bacterium]
MFRTIYSSYTPITLLLICLTFLVACEEDEPGNRAPLISDQTFTVSENAAVNFKIGNVVASDPDGTEIVFGITFGNSDKVFSVGTFSGELTVRSVENLDFQRNHQYVLTVEVKDGLLVSSATIVVNVIDEENRPPVIANQVFSVSEDAAVGDEIGEVQASDPDGGDLSFSIISGNSDGLFGIDPTTGTLSIASVSTLDFETKESYTLAVRVRDTESLGTTATITVNVLDVMELTPSFVLAGSTFEMNDGLIRELGVTSVSSFHYARTFALTDGDYFFSPTANDFRVNGATIGVFSVLFSSNSKSFLPGNFIQVDTATTTVVDVLGKSFIHSSAFIIDGNNDGSVSINVDDVVYGITGGTIEVSENVGSNNYTLVYDVEVTLYDVATSKYINSVKANLNFIYSGLLEFSDERGRTGGRGDGNLTDWNALGIPLGRWDNVGAQN